MMCAYPRNQRIVGIGTYGGKCGGTGERRGESGSHHSEQGDAEAEKTEQ